MCVCVCVRVCVRVCVCVCVCVCVYTHTCAQACNGYWGTLVRMRSLMQETKELLHSEMIYFVKRGYAPVLFCYEAV